MAELYQDKDTTNRTIINKFTKDGCWGLLQKLAEVATFATGETGAHFWVDPGGAFRFKKYAAFVSPGQITDGSDGNPRNIKDMTYRESIKETPRLVNDCQVVIFEEEYNPIDQDAMTESAEGWSSPDPIDIGSPFSDAGDFQAGTASIHFNTTNPGVRLRMRISWPDFDITGYDRIKFLLKYGAGLTVDNFLVRIWRSAIWVTDHLEDINVADQGAAAWHEYNIPIAGMVVTGNPGNIINVVQIEAVQAIQIGVGGVLIDKLRFIRDEKGGSASDAVSQAAYGKRTLRIIDKSITNEAFADDLADNVVENRKHPTAIINVSVPGKGQSVYFPPQDINVYSQKDGINGETFQIQKARHRITTEGGYVCELNLVASKTAAGVYSSALAPAVDDLDIALSNMAKNVDKDGMGTLRSNYLE